MKTQDHALEQYRRQLNRWVAAMVREDNAAVHGDAAERYGVSDMDLFTEGNVNKRADILDLQLAFLRPAFENLEDLINEYMATQPLPAFRAGPADAADFLRWLAANLELTPEQADYVACRQARYGVEDLARARRPEHIRFQERLSVAEALARKFLTKNGRLASRVGRGARGRKVGAKSRPGEGRVERACLRVHMNPTASFATLQTREFLDDQTELPGHVVFFAAGTEIRSAVLDDPVPSLLRLLAEKGPLTLADWAECGGLHGSKELVDVVTSLVELGLVAFS